MIKYLLRILCVLFAYLIFIQGSGFTQMFSYSNEPLLSVISDIESKTEYRFLYREALISNIKVTFDSDESSVMQELTGRLKNQNIGLKVDYKRLQALVYATSDQQDAKDILITGFILDANTGERLPYSTIAWRDNGTLQGTSSNPSGIFTISTRTESKKLSFLVSFVGYEPQRFDLPFNENQIWKDISIRLAPEPYSGKEILVQGVNFYTASDTVTHGLIKVGTFSPLGESNAVRSLQTLPSVTMSSAINNGINIRGSSSDGFQVMLDGQTVYHQSHLFGLLDAMNPDVLKTSGFYYDVTPAQFQAPLGGTLSLITRTGSLNGVKGSAGFSNTATKATLEGPIKKGRSSWLISGRISHLDEINWFNNQSLIEYGLDVNRPAGIILEQDPRGIFIEGISLNEVNIQSTEARFYDLHGKLYFENKKGSQLSFSGYLGHDNASQEYLREQNSLTVLDETLNEWDTHTLSSSYNTQLSSYTFSNTNIGLSEYSSIYSKDDFEYQARKDNNRNQQPDTSLIAPLVLQNSLTEFDVNQSFITVLDDLSMEYGFNYSDFTVNYVERSLSKNSFSSKRNSQLVDFFHQLNISKWQHVALNIGNRAHYFSNGKYLRWSPRIKAYLFPDNAISFDIGFSRNYQFLHRLQFYNINSSDFWILSNEGQPPSSVNYYSGGIKINHFQYTYFQIEGYLKDYENLRLHELNTGSISQSFKNDDVPWLYENTGIGRGIEFLMKNRFQKIILSSAYTLSSMQIKNERINNGNYFYADWDRRHQLSLISELEVNKNFDFFLSWTYGSGAPDRLNLESLKEDTRLPDYSRFDATLSYSGLTKSGSIKAAFSIYNLLNRENPWYSEIKQISVEVRDRNNNRNVQASAPTNVFDLGIQPSFNIGFYF